MRSRGAGLSTDGLSGNDHPSCIRFHRCARAGDHASLTSGALRLPRRLKVIDMRTARVPILVRPDLGNDLAADVTVRQPIQACRNLSPGDHLDWRQTDGTLD